MKPDIKQIAIALWPIILHYLALVLNWLWVNLLQTLPFSLITTMVYESPWTHESIYRCRSLHFSFQHSNNNNWRSQRNSIEYSAGNKPPTTSHPPTTQMLDTSLACPATCCQLPLCRWSGNELKSCKLINGQTNERTTDLLRFALYNYRCSLCRHIYGCMEVNGG